MDYGFAPGQDKQKQDERARVLFTLRAGTALVHHPKTLLCVRDFTQHLKNSNAIQRPVGNVLIGSHATSKGVMVIPLFRGQKGPSDYETLEEAIGSAAKSIAIDDAVFGYANPTDPATHTVFFKGCNLAKSPAFVTKFKEALGGHIILNVPIHFHGMWHHPDYGLWEYMSYEFVLPTKTGFATRDELIAAFKAARFTLVDNTVVPDANWDKWIPKKIDATNSVMTYPKLHDKVGNRSTIEAPIQLRVSKKPYVHSPIEFPTPADVPVKDPARQMHYLELSLGADPLFQEPGDANPHPFPMYDRMGYNSRAEFLAGYVWTGSKDGKKLNMIGKRVEYTLVVPILDAANELIHNFHPSKAAYQAVTQFNDGDARFFVQA